MADQTEQERDAEAFAAAVAAARDVLGDVPEETVAAALRAAGAVQDEHDQAYADRLVAETGIAGMDIDDGTARLRLVLAHELAAKMCLALRTILDAQPGAENYVEQEITDRETRERYVYIACKPGGKTPHQLRREAEANADELRAELVRMSNHGVREYGNGYRDSAALIEGYLAAGVSQPAAKALDSVRKALVDQAAALYREFERAEPVADPGVSNQAPARGVPDVEEVSDVG